MNFTKGRLVIISGPSGVGKDTVIDEWMRKNPEVKRVIAYTTREPRPGEENGLDYHFVSIETFEKLREMGAFLEFKQVYGNFYATPINDMESLIADGKIALLKIDVQGAIEAMKKRPDAMTIFIMPPSDEELEKRITGRGTEEPDVIQRRLQNARSEIKLSRHYQYKVVNDTVENAVEQLQGLVAEEPSAGLKHA